MHTANWMNIKRNNLMSLNNKIFNKRVSEDRSKISNADKISKDVAVRIP